jgi:hypothetical protein
MFFMVPQDVLQELGILSPATIRASSPLRHFPNVPSPATHADQNRNYRAGPSSPYIPVTMKRKDKMRQEAPEDQPGPDPHLPNQDEKDQTRSHTSTPEFQTFQHPFESMTGMDYAFQSFLQHSNMTTILVANAPPETIASYDVIHARVYDAYRGYLEKRRPSSRKFRSKRHRPYPETNPARSTHNSPPRVLVSDHEERSSQTWREADDA